MGNSESYTRRVVDAELDELLPHLPAIALDGAKGVGKTATATVRAATTYRLDVQSARELLEADPARLTAAPEPILVDEHQRWEPAWDLVRRAVDDDPRPSRFLLTGSATMPHPSSHSGAGRIVRLPMRAMTLPERLLTSPTVSLTGLLTGDARIEGSTGFTLADYTQAIVRGGSPACRHCRTAPTAQRWPGTPISSSTGTCPRPGSGYATRPRCAPGCARSRPPPRRRQRGRPCATPRARALGASTAFDHRAVDRRSGANLGI